MARSAGGRNEVLQIEIVSPETIIVESAKEESDKEPADEAKGEEEHLARLFQGGVNSSIEFRPEKMVHGLHGCMVIF